MLENTPPLLRKAELCTREGAQPTVSCVAGVLKAGKLSIRKRCNWVCPSCSGEQYLDALGGMLIEVNTTVWDMEQIQQPRSYDDRFNASI